MSLGELNGFKTDAATTTESKNSLDLLALLPNRNEALEATKPTGASYLDLEEHSLI